MVVCCESDPYTNPTPTLHRPYTHLVRLLLRRGLCVCAGRTVRMVVRLVLNRRGVRRGAVWAGWCGAARTSSGFCSAVGLVGSSSEAMVL